jgi:hypothetical protein
MKSSRAINGVIMENAIRIRLIYREDFNERRFNCKCCIASNETGRQMVRRQGIISEFADTDENHGNLSRDET